MNAEQSVPDPKIATLDSVRVSAAPINSAPGHTERSAELAAVVGFFESLSMDSVAMIGRVYAMEAFFKDPFNEVRGVSAIQRIFAAMFSQVRLPRFRVLRAVQSGKAPHWEREAFLTWEFDFYLQNYATQQLQTIRGSTHLQFNEDGRIIYHRDYWDAAEELYEKLPILGGLMRWLKRRAQH